MKIKSKSVNTRNIRNYLRHIFILLEQTYKKQKVSERKDPKIRIWISPVPINLLFSYT